MLFLSESEALWLFVGVRDRVCFDSGDLLGEFVEKSFDVLARLGGGLEIEQIHLLSVFFALLVGDLPLLVHITLIAHQNQKHVVLANGLSVFDPLVHRLEGLCVRNVVADYRDGAVLNVGRNEGFEALLSGSVPQIQNNHLVFYVHLLGHKVNSDRGLVVVLERFVDKTVDNAGFADVLVAKENNFVLVLARIGGGIVLLTCHFSI